MTASLSCDTRSTRPALGLVTLTEPDSVRSADNTALRARATSPERRHARPARHRAGLRSDRPLPWTPDLRRPIPGCAGAPVRRVARSASAERSCASAASTAARACRSLRVSRNPAAARDMRATTAPRSDLIAWLNGHPQHPSCDRRTDDIHVVHSRAPLVDDFDSNVASIDARHIASMALGRIATPIAMATTAAAAIQNTRTRRERR